MRRELPFVIMVMSILFQGSAVNAVGGSPDLDSDGVRAA